ncbi:MAG TPA: hypothetical protein VFW19_16715 [Allosphingosinicella sp.]|nr:hypothetical protein [Allosphingosinicella sp.]
MGPGIFLIAIFGCGEGHASCQPVRMLQTRYESRAACMAATENALVQSGDLDYPTIVAQCVAPQKAAAFRLSADEVTRPSPPSRAVPPERIAARD